MTPKTKNPFAFLPILLATACGCATTPSVTPAPPPALQRFEFVRPKMGTVFNVIIYAADAKTAESGADAAFARVDDLNARLSDYDPNSELSRISQLTNNGPMTRGVHVSEDLWTIMVKAREISQLSGGAFDVTVGPFVRLWRRSRALGELPTEQRIAEARKSVGYGYMELNATDHTVRLTAAHMRLDLGGIAKGYAAEQALYVLKRLGLPKSLVGAAGDVAIGDAPPGRPGWTMAFETPGSPAGTNGIYVRLCNQRVSTSGDTYRFVEIDGKRYSHIIDPWTGLGQTRRIEASVISNDGMTADTMALVVCVLGPEKGFKLVDAMPGAAAICTTFDNGEPVVHRSARFRDVEVKVNGAADVK